MKSKTTLQELEEWIQDPHVYLVDNTAVYNRENTLEETKHVLVSRLKDKIKELLVKEREIVENAYNQGDTDMKEEMWESFGHGDIKRSFLNSLDYFEKTFKNG